ncbi:MAG: 16S rRNA (adenine(1518)-N(6)/adenine(1519)-N(6))-dimethyltransferase [Geobacter sp.]|nr:MAG: 16S rRNA (adenine(1518)-N(6)/adenine(1519)-N(6))-dimethyltransferase [Geobacter sp.]
MERIRPKKALGQNFLTDHNVLARIVDTVELAPDDHVLEVGPGQGALTRLLAARAARVVAVELDRQLVPLLRREFADSGKVEVVEADILRADLPELLGNRWEGRWKVAANLPYNISTPVLFQFMEHRQLFSRLVLMLQKEVGERLAAPPDCKEYGVLSVFCQLHFDIRRMFLVKPGSFFPAPKVDSVVLRLIPLAEPRVTVGDEALFRRVVKSAFSQRRKTLWNCLKSGQFLDEEVQLRKVLDDCGINPSRRGETLSLEDFARLANALELSVKP